MIRMTRPMTACIVLKAFPLSLDGITTAVHPKGSTVLIPDDLFPGLFGEGFVDPVDPELDGEQSPEVSVEREIKVADKEPETAASSDDRDVLRSAYVEMFGREPDGRWSDDTLRAKLIEGDS